MIDDTMATNVEGVWAIGDIANDHQLKHLANAEAKVAFWNIAHPDDIDAGRATRRCRAPCSPTRRWRRSA